MLNIPKKNHIQAKILQLEFLELYNKSNQLQQIYHEHQKPLAMLQRMQIRECGKHIGLTLPGAT
ncbi:hypothetical protein BC938DRAFT_478835 [Jimgerdemannia flammicorona]|uniref:Uncharacterized protein n=1 Tax=Jimgerdemannia flammicorona TaxID=994334 RepID=A0A433QM70_9FUNG|nr:hypothetical protein BC938DRAFT_478835 [Jimgerdemannia flammicorona]